MIITLKLSNDFQKLLSDFKSQCQFSKRLFTQVPNFRLFHLFFYFSSLRFDCPALGSAISFRTPFYQPLISQLLQSQLVRRYFQAPYWINMILFIPTFFHFLFLFELLSLLAIIFFSIIYHFPIIQSLY